MNTLDLFALLPLMILTTSIILVMLVIAFARNLALTCLLCCLGLASTLLFNRLGGVKYRFRICDTAHPG